jgi:nicotinate-nucleotide--dimethylbenzimidazole phosphoribosyltransferase
MDEVVGPLLADLPGPDANAARAVRERAARALRPAGALERLDELAAWLAGWQRSTRPVVRAPAALVFVGDHGVAAHGVSAYPQSTTATMLNALRAGAATAGAMARAAGARLVVVDAGVGRPTGDITIEPVLSPGRFMECFELGRDAVASLDADAGRARPDRKTDAGRARPDRKTDAGRARPDRKTDVVVVGEMGIANTTAAAAVCAALFGLRTEDWVGVGTGVDERGYARKVAAVEAARNHVDAAAGPLEVLRRVGGAELVAIAGAVLEARLRSIPVLLDGFVVGAAVAPLELVRPGALDHCEAGHCSSEPGHRLVLDKLARASLLDLGLRLGEASGAIAALPLLRLAAAAATEVATFDEWGLLRAP